MNVFIFNESIFKCVFCKVNLVCKITNKRDNHKYFHNFNTLKNYITPPFVFMNKNDKLRLSFTICITRIVRSKL